MKSLNLFVPLALASTLAACASTYQQPSMAPDESATVVLYRTRAAFHSVNPERPFFYVDGKKVGQLGTGDFLSIPVSPGAHSFTVKESMMFMPAFESGRVELNAEAAQTYYLRYSMDFSGVASTGTQTVPVGTSTFSQSTQPQFESRN